jgi:hypothetical protein
MHDPGHDLARDLRDELARRFKTALAPVTIRLDPAVREAASYGQPVGEYAPGSPGAADYAALGDWVHEQSDARSADAVTVEVKQTGVPLGARRRPASGGTTDNGRSGFGRARPLPTARGGTGTVPTTETTPAPAGEANAIGAISRVEDLCRRAQALHDRIRPEPATSAGPGVDQTRLRSVDGTVRLVEKPVDRTRREKSVGRLFGVRQTTSGLLFVQPIELGLDVRVAGDFNGWSPGASAMRRNESLGVHELTIPVEPGRHRYRLVVDGAWRADPFNPLSEPNEYGDTNSVVEVE